MTEPGIVGDALALNERIGRLKAVKRSASHAQLAATRAGQLSDRATALGMQMQRVAVFRQRGIAVSLPAGRALDLLKRTREYRDAYRSDQRNLIGDPDDSSFKYEYLAPLEGLARQVGDALLRAWQDHLDTVAPSPQADLLSVLGQLPSFVAQVEALRSGQARLADARDRVPRTEDELQERGRDLPAGLSRSWADLSGGGITPEVLAFVRAATSG